MVKVYDTEKISLQCRIIPATIAFPRFNNFEEFKSMNNISNASNALSALLDKDSRQNIMKDPEKYARSLNMDVEGKEVVVVVCGKNTLYIPLSKVSIEMSPVELDLIRAAGTASTAGSAGTLSTIATAPASLSTAGTASSVGSGGTAA